MKAAFCFFISYEHVLHQEEIWKKWLQPNKDIITIYFHYTDYSKIKSRWIKNFCIPPNFISKTSYFHMVDAYISTLKFATLHDNKNEWFCLITDACVPIISPEKFRSLFFENYEKTIMQNRKSWWNINYCKRANLIKIPENLHLANSPWFVMSKKHVFMCIHFSKYETVLYKIIKSGIVANESIFAIILKYYRSLEGVINEATHITDWSRCGVNSPYVFEEPTSENMTFIKKNIEENKYAIFLRKVNSKFPREVLEKIIFDK